MNRKEIIQKYPLQFELEKEGYELIREGEYLKCNCMFHKDEETPSFKLGPDLDLWHCFGCNKGGSVIDWWAMRDGVSVKEVLARYKDELKLVAEYDYTDEQGQLLYTVCRFEPKTFRQRAPNGSWTTKGLRRVLLNLPAVLAAEQIWIAEGEKDVTSLGQLDIVATTNSGGAGRWMDSYSDVLRDKRVVICPDQDEAGQAHSREVINSLAGKAKEVLLWAPNDDSKDISEYLERHPDASSVTLSALCKPAFATANVPIQSMAELEQDYIQFCSVADEVSLDLGKFLPGLAMAVRPLVPGDSVVVLGDTGAGKTAFVQHIALAARPMPVLFFQTELAPSLVYERFLQMCLKMEVEEIAQRYRGGGRCECSVFDHISNCTRSGIPMDEIRRIVDRAELKMGQHPRVVCLDYLQLVGGRGGSRYEKTSEAAEQCKIIAKETNSIFIAVSQIHRKQGEADPSKPVHLHDARDSSSIEQCAGLVMGVWMPTKESLMVKVLKNTKGQSGREVLCDFNGLTFDIKEAE